MVFIAKQCFVLVTDYNYACVKYSVGVGGGGSKSHFIHPLPPPPPLLYAIVHRDDQLLLFMKHIFVSLKRQRKEGSQKPIQILSTFFTKSEVYLHILHEYQTKHKNGYVYCWPQRICVKSKIARYNNCVFFSRWYQHL